MRALLGQHALAYVLAAYWRVIAVAPDPVVSARAAGLAGTFRCCLLVQLVQFSVRMLAGADSPGISYFIGPCFGTLLVAAADLRSLAAAASTGRP
jgi:predicted RNA methylase